MKQTKSVRLEQWQCEDLESLKIDLRKMGVVGVTDSAIFRVMLNFILMNKESVKDIIVRNGFVRIKDLKPRSV